MGNTDEFEQQLRRDGYLEAVSYHLAYDSARFDFRGSDGVVTMTTDLAA